MRHRLMLCALWCGGMTAAPALVASTEPQPAIVYRLESNGQVCGLRARFTADQLGVLEKLNRVDEHYLRRLRLLVVPDEWPSDERAHSPMPADYPAGAPYPTLLVVHLPGQVFGAYESGTLVRWGPVSSGGPASPTRPGFFYLNWKSVGHASSVNPEWFLPWYFNFGNRAGLAFHAYALPGGPASHGCLRLLARDARWLFAWGREWTLDASGTRLVEPGTPVFVTGAYDFGAPPPWRSTDWLARPVELPPPPGAESGT